jgi:hypothetical protein
MRSRTQATAVKPQLMLQRVNSWLASICTTPITSLLSLPHPPTPHQASSFFLAAIYLVAGAPGAMMGWYLKLYNAAVKWVPPRSFSCPLHQSNKQHGSRMHA